MCVCMYVCVCVWCVCVCACMCVCMCVCVITVSKECGVLQESLPMVHTRTYVRMHGLSLKVYPMYKSDL